MSLIKPGRWSWNQASLSPEGQSLARGLIACVPFFGLQGTRVFDVVGRETSTIPSGWTWEIGGYGGGAFKTSSETPLLLTGTEAWYAPPFTVITVVDRGTLAASVSALVANRFGAGGSGWALKAEQWSSSNKIGFTAFGVADYTSALPTEIGRAVIGASVDTASNLRMFSNGVIDNFGTIGTIRPTTQPLQVGGAGTGDYVESMFHAVYFWNRALTDVEIQTVSADPFVLLRPALLTTETAAAGQIISIGAATETETAQAVNTFLPFVSCGLPFQLPRVLPTCELVGPITVAIGAATEADVAAAVQAKKSVTVTGATETETPQPVGATKPIIVAITTITETETAAAISATKQSTVSPGSETETPQPVSAPKTVSVTPATETGSAELINAMKDIIITIGATTETEAAQPIAALISNLTSVGVATESEAAWIVAVLKPVIVAVGAATETETAYVVTVVTTGGVIKFVVASVTHPTATATVTHPTATGIVD